MQSIISTRGRYFTIFISHVCCLVKTNTIDINPETSKIYVLSWSGQRSSWLSINIHPYTDVRVHFMLTSSNGNIFRVTGLLWGEFTGHRWIPLTKASGAELWYFLWSASWVNNRSTDDLRRHRTHYDVIVIFLEHPCDLQTYLLNGSDLFQ